MAAAVIVLVGLTLVAAAPAGPLALLPIVLPHLLLLVAAIAAIAALLARTRRVAAALAVIVAVVGARLGSEWLSAPADRDRAGAVAVMSWNLEVGAPPPDTVASVILEHDAAIVALQELTPDAAAGLERDPRITSAYPHRVLVPQAGVRGMGLLSRHPVVAHEATADPPLVAARLALPGGHPLHVVNAHPLPGRIETATPLRIPVGFEPSRRDAGLRRVRAEIDERLASGDPVIALGDFNVASTEPAYGWLAAGLHDVHVEVGLGPGGTWRPGPLQALGLGVLRIDYVFTDPTLTPLGTALDCRPDSDHCIVLAEVR